MRLLEILNWPDFSSDFSGLLKFLLLIDIYIIYLIYITTTSTLTTNFKYIYRIRIEILSGQSKCVYMQSLSRRPLLIGLLNSDCRRPY